MKYQKGNGKTQYLLKSHPKKKKLINKLDERAERLLS